MILDKNWNFKPALPVTPPDEKLDAQSLEEKWYPIDVPGTVHTALYKNGVIEDPFYRTNEARLQWLEQLDWVFETTFDAEEEMLQHDHIELEFKGLDTYADVFLNGELVLKGSNVFRTWRKEIKPFLLKKGNILRVYFYSPVRIEEVKKAALGYDLPGGSRVFTRKAQFNYGWDWGPRLVSCGILQSVALRAWSNLKVRDFLVKQMDLDRDTAALQGVFTIETSKDVEAEISILVDSQTFKRNLTLPKGENLVAIDFIVENPKLWWSNGLGEPYLYDITANIALNNGQIETKHTRIGLRTIELVQKKDAKGHSFYFRLNGVPVFMKGANYIPQDILQDRVTREKYIHSVDAAVAANMNMLRVWGGGLYENDEFYDLCDEKGILIWQDFMFACAMYPGDSDFLENIREEATEQVKRLHNHACLALWCGNNENNEAWHNWGWQLQFALNPKRKDKIWNDYQLVFNGILPNVVAEFSNATPYWESSPSYSRYNPKSFVEGDNHYWGIWHDQEPFEKFEERIPRFMSEYGFQSFPSWKTIKTFTEAEDLALESPVMLAHQKHPKGNQLIRTYMERDYRKPSDFQQFVYFSQLLQAEGMRVGIEAHRRAMPYCMGTLYWQLNDVWPVASWSSIDGGGEWKAMHYFVREVYKDIIVSPVREDNHYKIYVISDRLKEANVELEVKSMDFYGSIIFQEKVTLAVAPSASGIYYQSFVNRLQKDRRTGGVAIVLTLRENGNVIHQRIAYLVPPKDLLLQKPIIQKKVNKTNGGYNITLQSNVLAKNVYLNTEIAGFFTQNFFDLLPNEPMTIFFKTSETLTGNQITITSY